MSIALRRVAHIRREAASPTATAAPPSLIFAAPLVLPARAGRTHHGHLQMHQADAASASSAPNSMLRMTGRFCWYAISRRLSKVFSSITRPPLLKRVTPPVLCGGETRNQEEGRQECPTVRQSMPVTHHKNASTEAVTVRNSPGGREQRRIDLLWTKQIDESHIIREQTAPQAACPNSTAQ